MVGKDNKINVWRIDVEKLFTKKNTYRLINKDITNKLPFGYCNCMLHKGYLTKNLIDNKKCICKGCKHYIQNPNHPYYVQRMQAKAKAKARKKGMLTYEFNGVTYILDDKPWEKQAIHKTKDKV